LRNENIQLQTNIHENELQNKSTFDEVLGIVPQPIVDEFAAVANFSISEQFLRTMTLLVESKSDRSKACVARTFL